MTFAGEGGEPLSCLHPIDTIGVNGLHAVVVAPALVRVEILRTGRTYELLITGHRVGEAEKGRRPAIESKVLFQGVHGYLDAELWRKDKEHETAVMPSFYSLGGEPVKVPRRFETVTRAIVRATNCCGCSHSHYLIAGPAAATVVVETLPVGLPRPAIENVDLGMAAAGAAKGESDQTG